MRRLGGRSPSPRLVSSVSPIKTIQFVTYVRASDSRRPRLHAARRFLAPTDLQFTLCTACKLPKFCKHAFGVQSSMRRLPLNQPRFCISAVSFALRNARGMASPCCNSLYAYRYGQVLMVQGPRNKHVTPYLEKTSRTKARKAVTAYEIFSMSGAVR